MGMISFRYLVTRMLLNKPEDVAELSLEKIDRVLAITGQDELSAESCAIIIMTAESELERNKKC